ncbi:transcriptional regulator [Clostridium tyrobutyricum]|uniref:helix-turn-helix transcriptional regulator n=1 Tax=Clostridium tyrobutyricum TaxID=1519 RepID=UPI001C37F45E|nr:transcriptional regulator [Clostridium tyrobutyricum]MBR9648901.1 transcriptional regulator [Clostridium tyrobutyricum]MBV4420422.1 transcriptional regulator [Clostridium tyrobutyricum]
MSKFSNLLDMIILLKSRGKMKCKDIAEELEVDERQVRKYKQDLELAGVNINSTSGIDGGYSINGYDYLLNMNISEEELSVLNLANIQLKSMGFFYYKEFNRLMDKINIFNKSNDNVIVQYFEKSAKENMDDKNKKKTLDINYAIITRRKVHIEYFSLSSGLGDRVIHPYVIISYKGALYIIAFCEKRNEIRDFKISRIKKYSIFDFKFKLDKNFDLKKYMKDSFGIYRDDRLNVKLRIYKPMSYIISEKIWVENQKITWNDDESIIFEASMTGKTEIVSWILSMGSSVKVKDPPELKKIIKEEIDKVRNYY